MLRSYLALEVDSMNRSILGNFHVFSHSVPCRCSAEDMLGLAGTVGAGTWYGAYPHAVAQGVAV